MKELEIMERFRNPVYRGDVGKFFHEYSELPGSMVVSASGDNPFCGDTLRIAIAMSNSGLRIVDEACYEGYACSLCIASVEVLLESLKGKSVDDCLATSVEELLTGLNGIVAGRSRLKCVELPLSVLKKALCSCQ